MRNTRFFFLFANLFAVLCILDYGIGKFLEYLYFNQKQGKLYNITYAIEEQTNDVIVMGSSRAMHHYNPDIISDSLKLSCYNAGYDGQGILYHEAILNTILQRYTPKIIILDVNNYELSINEASYDLLSILNPYVAKHPILKETVNQKGKFERYKFLSHIYPYNSLFARIIMGNLNFSTKDVSENGFTAQTGIWEQPIDSITFLKNEILDKQKVHSLNKFLKECKKKGTSLYVIYSPTYRKEKNVSKSINYIKNTCKEYDIPFISYQNNPNFTNNLLFHDFDHLNDKGAEYFSSDIVTYIKKIRNH
ncbi:hypothetical protein VCM39_09995 [Bacteroides sp. CG01]|uniref:hypothetical protein n=1 Tax=Bacteroides sp. CG01 TaxID=3096000 RepID=UPI002AFEAC53|nr:hypothetical protein [Bacteroides sp. CG01]